MQNVAFYYLEMILGKYSIISDSYYIWNKMFSYKVKEE